MLLITPALEDIAVYMLALARSRRGHRRCRRGLLRVLSPPARLTAALALLSTPLSALLSALLAAAAAALVAPVARPGRGVVWLLRAVHQRAVLLEPALRRGQGSTDMCRRSVGGLHYRLVKE